MAPLRIQQQRGIRPVVDDEVRIGTGALQVLESGRRPLHIAWPVQVRLGKRYRQCSAREQRDI